MEESASAGGERGEARLNPLHYLEDEQQWKNTRKDLVRVSFIVLLYVVASLLYSGLAIVSSTPLTVLTANPGVDRPLTRSCKVDILENQTFAAGIGQPFNTNYTPPVQCPPPWAKVVLSWNGTVPVGQYDHVGAVWLGRVEIFRTITPETGGQRWHVEKDVTQYAPVMAVNQTLTALVGVGDARIIVTAALIFYETTPTVPAAYHPDSIMPIASSSKVPWFTIGADSFASSNISLPMNTLKLELEIYATAHGCEETWYSNSLVPNSSCHGANLSDSFREIQVFLDGKLAGTAWPFPFLYTGGLRAELWESIPPLNDFNIPPYSVELTPFTGMLVDGRTHKLTIQVTNNHGYWLVDGNLLLSQNPTGRTSGRLTGYSLSPSASEKVTTFGFPDTRANRSVSISGYMNTSIGQITTNVNQSMVFSDNLVPNAMALSIELNVNAGVITTISTTTLNGTRIKTSMDLYRVTIREGVLIKSGLVKLLTTLTVDQEAFHTTNIVGGNLSQEGSILDSVHAELYGTTSENHVSNFQGECFHHYLAALLGSIVSDTRDATCLS